MMKKKESISCRIVIGVIALWASLIVGRCAGLEDLTFLTRDGSVIITDCDPLASGGLIIPSKLEGKRVVEIGESAFAHCDLLTSVIVPDGVERIGNRAFEGCDGLKLVEIHPSVVTVGERAFLSCSNLEFVSCHAKEIGKWAFAACSKLRDASIFRVEAIGDSAFSGCTRLNSLDFGRRLKRIGARAFFQCSDLSAVYFPATLEDIGSYAFAECSKLEFAPIIGPLKKIQEGVFAHCIRLEGIRIPASVEGISQRAFDGCEKLRFITFDGDAPDLEPFAFLGIASEATMYVRAGRTGFSENLAGFPVLVIGQDRSRPDLKSPVPISWKTEEVDAWPTELPFPTGEDFTFVFRDDTKFSDVSFVSPGLYLLRFAYAVMPDVRTPALLILRINEVDGNIHESQRRLLLDLPFSESGQFSGWKYAEVAFSMEGDQVRPMGVSSFVLNDGGDHDQPVIALADFHLVLEYGNVLEPPFSAASQNPLDLRLLLQRGEVAGQNVIELSWKEDARVGLIGAPDLMGPWVRIETTGASYTVPVPPNGAAAGAPGQGPAAATIRFFRLEER